MAHREARWVYERVNHDNLLQQSRHGSKRVPQQRGEVGKDLSLAAQLNQRMLPRLWAAQLLDPQVYLQEGVESRAHVSFCSEVKLVT